MEKEFPMNDLFQFSLKASRQLFVAALVVFTLVTTGTFVSGANAGSDENTAQTAVAVEKIVNINTADAETLALALDGVGMSRARDIVAYREQHGEFTSIEQLTEVRGIGPATLERNRDRIVLADRSE
jgi:competence protein ComEA